MRRPLLALALLAGAVGAATQSASTASTALPSSTGVLRSTSVTGASMVSVRYTTSAGTITGLTTTLRGDLMTLALLPKPVTAQFGDGVVVTCTAGVLTPLSTITGTYEGTYTCLGLAESADRPRPLRIEVG